MAIVKFAVAIALAATLAGCDYLDTDAERGLAGAAAGAVAAGAVGGSALTGAAIGGAAGYFCDEFNVPGCIKR